MSDERENEESQELQDARRQVRDARVASRAEKYCENREYNLEPLSGVTEIDITPSYIAGETSERTLTPPYMRRYALPVETKIDRNVTRKRGTAAATERFPVSFTTESKKKKSTVEDEGYDPSFGHSPLRPTESPPTVEGASVKPQIVVTGAGASGQTEQVSVSVPAYISTGIFHPSYAPFQREVSLPIIPQERSEIPEVNLDIEERWKSTSVQTEVEKAGKSKTWKSSAQDFPPIEPQTGADPVTSSEAGEEYLASTSASGESRGITPLVSVEVPDSRVHKPLAQGVEVGADLPGFIPRRPSSVWYPPLPLDPPPPLPKQPPPPRDRPDPYLDDTEEFFVPVLEDEEEDDQSQHSEGQDVGDLRELLDKLTIGDEPEPEDHTALIDLTLEESKNVDRVLEEISEYRQRFVRSGVDDPEDSDKSESSETAVKKPKAGASGVILSHEEKVLLTKLRTTNQKLCKVTQLWKESERQAAYLRQQVSRLEGELVQKDKHFETVSKGNLQDRYQSERELKETITRQLQQINSLNAEKVRIEQVCDKERKDKVDWSDLATELKEKIAKLTEAGKKNTAELQEIAREQEDRISAQEQRRQELHTELHDLLEKQIELREQLTFETIQRENVEQKYKALLNQIEKDSKELPGKTESDGTAIRRRLSSTVNPQTEQASVFGDALASGISPIPHDKVTQKKVGFESEPVDIIDALGLGLGETTLSDIWATDNTKPIKKSTAEKPLEESEKPTVVPKPRLDPFGDSDIEIPGRISHWDIFDKSQGAASEVVGAEGVDVAKSKPTEEDEEIGRLYRAHRLSSLSVIEEQEEPEGRNPEGNKMPNFDLMTKLSKPTPFSGRDYESGREWLRRFDAYCISGGFDPQAVPPGSDQDSVFRAGMVGLLQGAAGVWLDSLPQDQRETYTALRKAFKDRWVLPYLTGTRLAEETRLAGRVQGATETCESLYQDLAQMCHKMGKGEQDLMIHFVRNLRPEIQDRVVTGCPKDMQTALQMAQSAEARLGITASAPSLTAMIEQNPHLAAMQKELNELRNRQEQLKQEKKPVCSYCQKPGHSQAECRIYKKDREQENQEVTERKQKPQQQRRSFDGQCYNCGQKGHLSRDCPQPRKPRGRGNQNSTIEELRKRIADLESKQKDQSPK